MSYVQLAKEIEANCYIYVGVRYCCEDEVVIVGESLRNSYDWDFDNDTSAYYTTGTQLDGVCALSIGEDLEECLMNEDFDGIAEMIESALVESQIYRSNEGAVVLVAGKQASYGTDENELIIRDAKVIYKFKENQYE